MPEIKLAFWNVGNLFDTTASPLAADLEFTPEQGWTPQAYDVKIKALAGVIRQLHDGAGPDLLGLCEIENDDILTHLLALNHACAEEEKAGEKITPHGLPLLPEEHAEFITTDCIEAPKL